jgi:hypothetical protein
MQNVTQQNSIKMKSNPSACSPDLSYHIYPSKPNPKATQIPKHILRRIDQNAHTKETQSFQKIPTLKPTPKNDKEQLPAKKDK